MADNFGQPNSDNAEEINGVDDPALNNRIRRDIGAALTPAEGEFRSRRTQIMEQLRAEAPASDPPTNISSFRSSRPSRFQWLGALAAALVVLLLGGAVLLNLNSNTSNPQPVANQGVLATNQATSGESARSAATGAFAAASATTAAGAATLDQKTGASGAAGAAIANATTAASATTTVAAAAAAAPAPPRAITAAATTAASATTAAASATTSAAGAATTAAANATTAAGAAITAAASTAQRPPATPAPASTAITTDTSAPLPIFQGASPLRTLAPQTLRLFLQNQLTSRPPPLATVQRLGLNQSDISRYSFVGSKLGGARAEDVLDFYQVEALRQAYTIEGVTILQDDNQLRVRWLYLSKGAQRLGVLVVEVVESPQASALQLAKGETGIFFVTTP